MAVGNSPTLSYHAQQYRVRIEITRAHTIASPTCPPEIIKRAKAKLEQLYTEKKIAFFDVFESRLAEIWEKLRTAEHLPANFSIGFTVASGAPKLNGLTVDRGTNDKTAILVSVAQGALVKAWQREWLRATIIHEAREQGVTDALSMAQVQSCIIRITGGENVFAYPIPLLKSFGLSDMGTRVFAIVANKIRGEVAVVINNIAAFRDAKVTESVHAAVIATVDKLNAANPAQYRYHRQDLTECISNALAGPEILGMGMPMIILAVTATFNTGSSIGGGATSAAVVTAPVAPKNFTLFISDDQMRATIANFKMDVYSNSKIKFDREWFENQLKSNHVVYGLQDDIWAKIEAGWAGHENLDGFIAAEGTLAMEGTGPYLHLVYKDAPEIADMSQVVNIREAQQRMLVQEGQLVAEVRYKKAAIFGRTVTGETVYPPIPANDIRVGQGIAQNEPGKFYATTDGLPVFDQGTLSVSKVFVHKGDVDLKSGNIHFDGPVEIKGSVDSGATVDVKGPLVIHGMIRGGFVYCQDAIEVKQGVVTTSKGLVKSKGNLTADFIENSQIHCGGTLTVNKAILNSNIFVTKNIIVTADDGIVGGGLISCRDALVSNNVGFPSGAKTRLVLGTDVKTLHRVTLRAVRVQKLKETSDRYRLELRELSGKKNAQLTPKHRQRKEKILKLLAKLKIIQEKADTAHVVAQSSVQYNAAAILVVYKRLSSNCSVEIAGQGVHIPTEMLSTAITAKKRRDSHMCTAEEVKLEVDRMLDHQANSSPSSAGSNEKKAS